MALVAAAIGNEGPMMQPYLVQSITRPDGSVIFTQFPKAIRLAMSKETATKMRANMKAVGQYGFGKIVSNYVPGVTVGGKSGTAEHGAGSTPHAWFIALAPIDQPKYAVAVMLESGGEGSSVGATLAGQVLKAAFETEK
jgi:peptidoglycan glycosyltransferase